MTLPDLSLIVGRILLNAEKTATRKGRRFIVHESLNLLEFFVDYDGAVIDPDDRFNVWQRDGGLFQVFVTYEKLFYKATVYDESGGRFYDPDVVVDDQLERINKKLRFRKYGR